MPLGRKHDDDTPPETAPESQEPAAEEAVSDPDAGVAEVQAKVDEAEEKGYIGTTPEDHDNEEFALTSGPDSPSAAEQLVKGAEHQLQRQRESITQGEVND